MYVIFPADELIYMTYGAAVPRFKPRPTLDNLHEPLVPIGTRPSSSLSQTKTNTTLARQRNVDDTISLSHNDYISSTSNRRLSKPVIRASLSRDSRDHSPSIVGDRLDYTNYLQSDIDDTYNDDQESNPSIYLEPPSSPGPPLSQPYSPVAASKHSSSAATTKKHRPKLHLSIGKLGRPNSNELPESSRLREEHHVRVSNPTFTRENLRQRNYDAFFESGEPVYSIEKRAPSQPPFSDFDPFEQQSNYLSPYPVANTPNHNQHPQPTLTNQQSHHHTLGFFHRRKKSTDIGRRSKSAEIENTIEASQKEPPIKTHHRSIFGWRGTRGGSLSPPGMATSQGILKDLGHPNINEALKSHNSVTFKLVKTVSDFTETLSQLYEQHAEALQVLVSTYRKKNGELRKERPASQSSLFHAWETFLQEIEADSQSTSDVASALSRQVARPLLERSFHRKVQSRKVFTHRESFDTIIAKTEEKLQKCRMDYKQCYIGHRTNPTQQTLVQYIDSHNSYVQQLHATNAMLESYHCDTIPQLLQELEDIYNDLCNIVSEAVLQGAEVISTRAVEQAKRYDGLANQCKSVSGAQDLGNFARVLLPTTATTTTTTIKVPRKAFAPPQPPPPIDGEDINEFENVPPQLKNELILERGASIQVRPSIEALKREAIDLETQIRQLQDSIDALVRTQLRGLESQLYNKANELQEDISMKKFDLRAKQIHLSAVKAQRELFLGKTEPGSPRAERKLSSVSSTSMKTKWLKAFRSLKPAGSAGNENNNSTSNSNSTSNRTNHMYHAVSTVLALRKNGATTNSGGGGVQIRMGDTDNHNLQEYTYKKITPCDVCSQVLRGHTRQGLRCRICKVNVHADCAPKLQKCQVKQKLLRRQKSTSEIENRVDMDEEKPSAEVDQIYQVLKQAGEISSSKTTGMATSITATTTTTTTTITAENIIGGGGGGGVIGLGSSGFGGNLLGDIPVVNVPECPDRVTTSRGLKGPSIKMSQGGGSSGITTTGGHYQQRTTTGLQAPPMADISSSVPVALLANITTNSINNNNINNNIIPVTTVIQTSDTGTRRRLFAGLRQLSGIGRGRLRSAQHRSISLPETPHSPRRHKLNLRMKSLSLDSPESSELHGQMRRRHPGGPSSSSAAGYHGGSGGALEHSTPPSNNSRLHSPSSPSSQQQRKLLYANRGLRTGSVDLPDEIEKSLSSASTSPCPSPVRTQNQKPHRLLPTNLYVVLYNFKARHPDELDLKAGYKVTVIDTSDPDWWKGKCLGRVGYFPSKYCTRLSGGEKPLQVTHNLQVTDGERGDNGMTLLRDQIVIQVGEEVGGMVMVRSAENRQGVCPVKYLQEV